MIAGPAAARKVREQTPETIETVAEYWNRRPCNIRHSTREVGSRDYFNEVEERKYFVEPHIPGFAAFEQWRGRRVLEIGCGIGTDAINFARAGADYTGIDVSEASLDIARRRFAVFGLRGRLIQCNAEELAQHVEAAAFDLVYSFGVIHHTPRPEVVLAQARKVVRPDGEFRLMLYARESFKDAMIEAGLDQPEAQGGCPIAFTYTRQQVTEMVNAAGFGVVSIEQDHIFPFVIDRYVRYEYELQPWIAAMPQAVFRALERRFGWHLLVAAKPR
ncbi:MAG TPA: class I SAM-dependent methyltransferase [Acetobacteraceae bacterium]|nr:class I SAM-dependent methyltransferase [Acetobacteraceae bacterium]